MVNFKPASIFKGILETQNSTRNGKNFAESGEKKIARRAVYHAGINYDAALLHGGSWVASSAVRRCLVAIGCALAARLIKAVCGLGALQKPPPGAKLLSDLEADDLAKRH